MNKKAVIAMSGGVDSSVAAILMLERGYECIGVTLKLFTNEDLPEDPAASRSRGCCSLADINDARHVSHHLGIPHYVFNFAGDFRQEVIRRFIETYETGGTPNPCIDCNRYIKFDRLLRRARQLDFDTIVTGHYARVEKTGDRYILKKPADKKKDQSYVLYAMTQDQLAHTQFPLGDMTKAQVREIALARGLVNAAKRDSQDICFAPGGDYPRFIENYTGKQYDPGDVVDPEGNILGRHRGIIRYTIGQRRGLGLACNQPVYVTAKSVRDNRVTLGPEKALYAKTLSADRINLIPRAVLERPLRVTAKTRYLQAEQEATAEQTGDDTIRVVFDKPQRAITPGQAVVLYQGDLVIGGGTIRNVE